MPSDMLVELFVSIGLSENKAKDTIKNDVVSQQLKFAIEEARKYFGEGEVPRNVGILLYHIATKVKPKVKPLIPLLVKYCCEEKIFTEQRLQCAIDYVMGQPNEPVNVKAFEDSCGVGIHVTPEQIEECVESVIKKHVEGLKKERYYYNFGVILGEVRKLLRFADGRNVKNEVDVQILSLLGPKTEDDLMKNKVMGKGKDPAKLEKNSAGKGNGVEASVYSECGARTIGELMKNKVNFHKTGENDKTEDYVVTPNTAQLLANHLKVTGGQVRTRFPPEPNGILHIGHAKAININFGYAMAHNGVCFLRYDDTNPEKEEERFFVGIRDMVDWLGYTPCSVTHSSDYFDQLYEWAEELVRRGNAYVCHQKADEVKGHDVMDSPWRDRPTSESLQLLRDMKNGKIGEGAATLRMRVTMEEGKKDPVAYRIKFVPHPRTGDKWCIYPTYDYAHCLCDSIENITHSLCTREFRNRRSSYYWLCNALDLYCPVQWEYGRLNMEYTVVSKRKIARLINAGKVTDWNDPRLFTLSALRRRGFPAEAINNFCARVGVSMANSFVEPAMLESCVRTVLDRSAPRSMVVLNPIKVVVKNLPAGNANMVEVPDFPNEPERGRHFVKLREEIFIDQLDFRETADPSYRRLTVKQPVGLRHAGLVIRTNRILARDAEGKVTALEATCEQVQAKDKSVKAFIHWVSEPFKCEVRIYERLFHHKNPEDSAEVPDGFLSDCREDSLTIIEDALADEHLKDAKVYDKFQFERVGYFSIDPDSTANKLVFNRTLQLKEDAGKDN